ncbi:MULTISPECIES: hypothetical protein [unclassified Clostridium]|uniref:hypothetical protein n=1 Tax=unclassified Clostridium TaxID=2614128 RepID=UPI000297A3F7|nr:MULTISPECIES: hypothetical protein [unclassified Clostridium]EKQ50983.1 MAG: hypothetical protein A370_05265 [Clostridium sp. Maddingley MBC34-26]
MLNKIILIICDTFMFFLFNGICRYNACYFRESLFNKYIIIENAVIKTLLIGKGVGRNRFVADSDANKLPIIGLMSYVTLAPTNLLKLILEIMMIFNYKGITNLKEIYQKVDYIFGMFLCLYLILLFINVCIIDHRRKVKK